MLLETNPPKIVKGRVTQQEQPHHNLANTLQHFSEIMPFLLEADSAPSEPAH